VSAVGYLVLELLWSLFRFTAYGACSLGQSFMGLRHNDLLAGTWLDIGSVVGGVPAVKADAARGLRDIEDYLDSADNEGLN
jgi:hypothetical protein